MNDHGMRRDYCFLSVESLHTPVFKDMLLQNSKTFWRKGMDCVRIVENLKLIGPTLRIALPTNLLYEALTLNRIGVWVELNRTGIAGGSNS